MNADKLKIKQLEAEIRRLERALLPFAVSVYSDKVIQGGYCEVTFHTRNREELWKMVDKAKACFKGRLPW